MGGSGIQWRRGAGEAEDSGSGEALHLVAAPYELGTSAWRKRKKKLRIKGRASGVEISRKHRRSLFTRTHTHTHTHRHTDTHKHKLFDQYISH